MYELLNVSFTSIFRVTFFWFLFSVIVQQAEGQGLDCKSLEPTEQEIAKRENQIQELKKRKSAARIEAEQYTYVPVRFHIVRYSDGSGGVTNSQINDAFAEINANFQKSGIQFYLAGSAPHFIDNSTYYDFDFSKEDGLTQGSDLSNAINIYILGSISYQSSSVTGYAYYPSLLANSNRVFVRKDRVNDSRTLAHELGHYFNLLHTFHNNSNSDVTKRELVTRNSGSNCEITGDLLCDTPADPQGLPNATTSGCSYTGTVTDANGELYKPSLVNMMGYYYSCGNEFTAGQYVRLSDGLLLRTDEDNQYRLNYQSISTVPTQVVANQNANGVQVTFQDVSSQESGYIIERATSQDGPYAPLKGLDANVTSWLDATVTTNMVYYYRVRASNSTLYSASDTAQVKLFYCRPTYNTANSPIFIADFLLNKNGTNLISKINTGAGPNSFSDFTSTVGQVTAGQSYDFIARAVTGGSGSYFPQHVSIWVDLNQNGVFEASEILFQSGSNQMSPSLSGTISLPAQTLPGTTRMRVRSQYYTNGPVTNPCSQLPYGEAEDYTLQVTQSNPPTVQVTSLSKTSACSGEVIQVYYSSTGVFETGNVFTVQIAKAPDYVYASIPTSGNTSPLTATIPGTLAAGTDYKVRIIASQAGVNGIASNQLLEVKPRIEATLSGGGNITSGDSATLIVTRTIGVSTWQFTLSDGRSYSAGSNTSLTVKVSPTATTTYTLSSVQDQTCGVGTGSGSATVNVAPKPTISVQIRVFLEGPYRSSNALMITTLNQRGLLPGQTPIGSTATPTPPGQPYQASPWNYSGTESVGGYASSVVDWILVSFRAGSPSVQNTVYKTAALLRNDGWVTFLDQPNLSFNTTYYIVIEHRNHLGVMSHIPVSAQNGVFLYNFTTQNSYTATSPVSVGQKQIGTIFAVLSSEGNKNPINQDFVINVNDYSLWSGANGKFDIYSEADFNMDAQISASDKSLWNSNNSKFSFIGRQ